MDPAEIDFSKLSPQQRVAILPSIKKTLLILFLVFAIPSAISLFTGNSGGWVGIIIDAIFFYVVWRLCRRSVPGKDNGTTAKSPLSTAPKNTVDILSKNTPNTGDPFL